jgi:hypothetical protein
LIGINKGDIGPMPVRKVSSLALAIGIAASASAADFQGLIVDWRCAKPIVQDGKKKTFEHDRSCSLIHNYQRQAYGLVTDDKKYYYLADPGNQHILQLLRGDPDKDDLKVIVTGELEGDTIHVTNVSML